MSIFPIISQAHATATPAGAPDPNASLLGGNILVFVLIFAIFYFLLIRPQQKRLKEHRNMIENLRRGDKVVTAGGIVGTVAKIENDNTVLLEIAPEIKVKVIKSTVTEVLSRPGAGNDNAPAEPEKPSKKVNK